MADKVHSPCVKCRRSTYHEILKEEVDHGTDDYAFTRSYTIIKCLGCETKSFRYSYKDIENAYPISQEEWEVPEEVDIYPEYDPTHVELDSVFHVPDIVAEIYTESVHAVRVKAYTLAGLGLRATIEAICNDKNIQGRDLAKRIAKMASLGLISANDASRLHAIRFMGNDAAHDIKKPGSQAVSVALKIINHLIESVYLLDREMNSRLDTIISEPEDFIKLLDSCIKEYNKGDEYPLAKYMGRELRRLHEGASKLEEYLVLQIESGDYKKLTIGKKEEFAGSKEPVQHFVLT